MKSDDQRRNPNPGAVADPLRGLNNKLDGKPLPQLDDSLAEPSAIWRDYFSKRKPDPATVQALILKLHENKRHEHVIASIEAALIAGQSQPWMYEVLALSMEITGRPKADVERVLLSIPDFQNRDFQSVVFSAAYLTRFGRTAQALRLYRQAGLMEPTRPEPYVLGLPLAKELKDYPGIRWTAAGILTYAWTRDRETLHREAENALLQAELDLKRSGREKEAAEMRATLNEALQRDLIVRVEWVGDGEVDLAVEEPPGTVCSARAPHSPGGGVLVHDGHAVDKSDCYDEYVCAYGFPGVYQLRLQSLWGDLVGRRAKVTIRRYVGTPNESKSETVVVFDKPTKLLRIALDGGRRKKAAKGQSDDEVTRLIDPTLRLRRLGIQRVEGNEAQHALRRFAESRRLSGAVGPNVGYQPIVTVVPEGTSLTTNAIVSGDRRYVRLSISPVFSNITDVFTFSAINGGGNPNGQVPGGGAGPGFGGPGFNGN